MIENHNEFVTFVQRALADYKRDRYFFTDHELPEYDVLEEADFDKRSKSQYITFTCLTNHIHSETGSKQTAGKGGLWRVCYRLFCDNPGLFDPAKLVGDSRGGELGDRLEQIDLMDSRDSDWWYRAAKTLYREFDSDPRVLLQTCDYDTESVRSTIEQYDFPGLSGQKVRALWLRLMNDEVHPLDNIAEVDIPVDFHIVDITGKLRGTAFDSRDEADKAEVRKLWSVICDQYELTPVHVDIPIWLLNKYWDSGGKEYVESTLRNIRE